MILIDETRGVDGRGLGKRDRGYLCSKRHGSSSSVVTCGDSIIAYPRENDVVIALEAIVVTRKGHDHDAMTRRG